MTKKQYNLDPSSLNEAKKEISEAVTEINNTEAKLNQVQQEKNLKEQELAKLSSKYTELLNNHQLSEDELIAQAKKLGMKTQEEYQAVLAKQSKDTPKTKLADCSWLWGVGAVVVFFVFVGWFKNKAKNS